MIRARKYVAPGTHGTNTTGPVTAPPYAALLHLRARYPLTGDGRARRGQLVIDVRVPLNGTSVGVP